MSTLFPGSIDSYTNPTPTSKRNNPSLAGEISDKNDAIVALETKVGVDSSAVTTTIDYKLKSTSSIDPGHKHTAASLVGVASVPTGAIVKYPLVTAPSSSFIPADGSAVSRIGQAALFALYGTTFGVGDGSTTFNVPLSTTSIGGAQFASSNFQSGNASSFILSHTIGSGDNLLVIGIACNTALVTPQYNGVNMTLIDALTGTAVEWYYMINPSVGTHNITASFTSGNYSVMSVSYSGINPTSSLDSHVTASTTGTSLLATSTSTQPKLILAYGFGGVSATPLAISNVLTRQLYTSNAGNGNTVLGELTGATTSTTLSQASSVSILLGVAAFKLLTNPTTYYDMIKT